VILVDSNVLLDVYLDDPEWSEWSQAQLDLWSSRGPTIVNPMIYAELAAGFDSVDTLDATLEGGRLGLEEIPREGLFLAAKAHLLYRKRGGARRGVLPDFLIGAHASIARIPLLTRDPRRYRSYFPKLEIVAP
jgi:predicted nucleic acid-binding protein